MRVCLCLACMCLAHLLIELTFSGSPLFERVKKVSECSQSGCNLFESIWHQNSGAPCSTATTLPEDFNAQPRISGTGDLPAQYALAKQRAAITSTHWPRPPHKRPVVAMAILYPTPPGLVFCTVLTPQAPSHPSPHPFTKNVLGHLQLKQLCSVFQRLFSCDIDRRRTRGRKKGENTNVKKRRESAVCSL